MKFKFFQIFGGIYIFAFMLGFHACGQTKGYTYNINCQRSFFFLSVFSENIDSSIYYYKEARKSGVYFKDNQLFMATYALFLGRIDSARAYLIEGAKKDFSWKDIKLCLKHARFFLKKEKEMRNRDYPFKDTLHQNQLLSKKAYKLHAAHQVKEKPNKWAKSLCRKMLRADQRYGRKNTTEKDRLRMREQDTKVFDLMTQLVDSLKRLPTMNEIGENNFDDLALYFIHMKAERMVSFMPFIVEAINNGTYFANEDIAYAIEQTGMMTGHYLVVNDQQKYGIFIDTTSQQNKMPVYSYLGEYYLPIKEDTIPGKRLYILPTRPEIGIKRVNAMRKLLCLLPWEEFIQRRRIAVINRYHVKTIQN
jgi:hypothetical protein